MHPLTQTILALGVLALVGMGGFVLLNGVPEYEREPTGIERLQMLTARADAHLCRSNLSRSWDELNRKGRADRVRCLARN